MMPAGHLKPSIRSFVYGIVDKSIYFNHLFTPHLLLK